MASQAELHVVDPDVAPAPSETEERILDAALVLVARWGVTKTALGDVAKQAGCSRATLYRAFPGGKQHLFLALATRELDAYRGAIADAVDAADTLEDALTMALVVAARLVRDHDAFQFILRHEPGLLLPFLGFHEVDVLFRSSAQHLGPHVERFLAPQRAAWAVEWAARLFLSYLFNEADDLDLTAPASTRALVRTFLMPALLPSDQPSAVHQ